MAEPLSLYIRTKCLRAVLRAAAGVIDYVAGEPLHCEVQRRMQERWKAGASECTSRSASVVEAALAIDPP